MHNNSAVGTKNKESIKLSRFNDTAFDPPTPVQGISLMSGYERWKQVEYSTK